MAVPPDAKSPEVFRLLEGLEQVVRDRLRVEFCFRIGCPLVVEEDLLEQKIVPQGLLGAQPAYLEWAKVDIQLQAGERLGGDEDRGIFPGSGLTGFMAFGSPAYSHAQARARKRKSKERGSRNPRSFRAASGE